MSGAAASSSGGFSGEQAGEVMNFAVEKFIPRSRIPLSEGK